MTFLVSADRRTLGGRLRMAVLTAFALLLAHDAIFAVQYGTGAGYAQAMREQGHDAYWVPYTLVVAGAAALTFLFAVFVVARLASRARGLPGAPADRSGYLGEWSGLWLRLFALVALLFTLQENLEHLFAGGGAIGLDPLGGRGYEGALLVLAGLTFILAGLGALLRWRTRLLRARIAAAARRPRRSPAGAAIPRPRLRPASLPAWLLVRRDAGRAPPLDLRPHVLAAA